MAESKPQRKSPAQAGELYPVFIPAYGHYRIEAKHGAKVPEELQGTYTNKKWVEQAVNLYFKKK